MNNSSMVPIVIIEIAAALFASSIGLANSVFAKKDTDSGSGSSSAKDDYDKLQKCLSHSTTGGSATKQQIKDFFDSIYGAGSSSTGAGRSGSGNADNSGGNNHLDSNPDSNN